MADSYIQLPPDSTGKKSATVQKTDGPDTVHVSRTIIEDAATLAQAQVTSAGALKVNTGVMPPPGWDYIGCARPDGNTEVYTYKSGGSSGTTIATATVVYSGGELVSVTWS